MGKFWLGKTLANLVCELFAKIFLASIHRYTKGECTDFRLIIKCFFANSFYLCGLIYFSLQNFFVYGIIAS